MKSALKRTLLWGWLAIGVGLALYACMAALAMASLARHPAPLERLAVWAWWAGCLAGLSLAVWVGIRLYRTHGEEDGWEEKHPDAPYETLLELTIQEFPELKPVCEAHLEEWRDEGGPLMYLVFEDIVAPHIAAVLDRDDHTRLESIFRFVERLARSEDHRTKDLVSLGLCDAWRQDPQLLAKARGYMGEFTLLRLGQLR